MQRFKLSTRYAVLGLIEGIVISLGLGAKTIFSASEPTNLGHVVINAGVFAALTNLTTSFFTEQFEVRRDLLNVQRMLVVSKPERVFGTDLYRANRQRALLRSLTYAATSFAGAAIPMVPLAVVPGMRAMGLVVPLVTLFGLGFYLGRRGAGNALVWALAMVGAGVIVTAVGVRFPV
jgi:predicted membrane protein (TIGR00267 family)